MNPDGVIHGNYRCNLSGVDLNRHWEAPNPFKHPTTHAVKRWMHALAQQRPILLYTDFHGHSTMKNFCLYGCSEENEGGVKPVKEEEIPDVKHSHVAIQNREMEMGIDSFHSKGSSAGAAVMANGWKGKERIFPMMLAARAPDYFPFSACKFSVLKKKRSSARVVFWRELRIWNSFTMEASFCSSSSGPLKGRHYNTTDYEKMGALFCQTIWDWIAPNQSEVAKAIQSVTKILVGTDKESKGSGGRKKKRTSPSTKGGAIASVRVFTRQNSKGTSVVAKSGARAKLQLKRKGSKR